MDQPGQSSCSRKGSGWTCNHCFSERWRDRGDGISLPSFGSTPLSLSSARRRNSFHSSLRVNGTANIGIASPGLVASDRQVWCPSLQQVAGKTPSPQSVDRIRGIMHSQVAGGYIVQPMGEKQRAHVWTDPGCCLRKRTSELGWSITQVLVQARNLSGNAQLRTTCELTEGS